MEELEYRWAKKEEWSKAMTMVWKTFITFEGKEYSREGIKNFFEFITDDRLFQAFLRGSYQMLIALEGEEIVGVATVRNGHHLSLLFVEEEHQHRGIGRELLRLFCNYLEEEAGEELMTLKAAPSAVSFYRGLGYRVMGPEEDYDGVRVISMEKRFH